MLLVERSIVIEMFRLVLPVREAPSSANPRGSTIEITLIVSKTFFSCTSSFYLENEKKGIKHSSIVSCCIFSYSSFINGRVQNHV